MVDGQFAGQWSRMQRNQSRLDSERPQRCFPLVLCHPVWSPGHAHLDVELLKLLQVQNAWGTVFEEAFVPLFELCLIKLCVLCQVIQDLWGQLAVVFPHPLWRRRQRNTRRSHWSERARRTITAAIRKNALFRAMERNTAVKLRLWKCEHGFSSAGLPKNTDLTFSSL